MLVHNATSWLPCDGDISEEALVALLRVEVEDDVAAALNGLDSAVQRSLGELVGGVAARGDESLAIRILNNAAADPAAARVALNGAAAEQILGGAGYDAFVAVRQTDGLQELVTISGIDGLSVADQQRVASLIFDDAHAASRAEGLLEIAGVTVSRTNRTVVGERIIALALDEWVGQYGNDAVDALVLGTRSQGEEVRRSLEAQGFSLGGSPDAFARTDVEDISELRLSGRMGNFLENLTAISAARNGRVTSQGPSASLGRSPNPDRGADLHFESWIDDAGIVRQGGIRDTVTASSGNAFTLLLNNLESKVVGGQTQRILFNLDRSPLAAADLELALSRSVTLEGQQYATLLDAIEAQARGTFYTDPVSGLTFPLLEIEVLKAGEFTTVYLR